MKEPKHVRECIQAGTQLAIEESLTKPIRALSKIVVAENGMAPSWQWNKSAGARARGLLMDITTKFLVRNIPTARR